jgi:uncharacterized protein
MENNHLSTAIVTSITTYAYKELNHIGLQFIPSALFAYIVGYNMIKNRTNKNAE